MRFRTPYPGLLLRLHHRPLDFQRSYFVHLGRGHMPICIRFARRFFRKEVGANVDCGVGRGNTVAKEQPAAQSAIERAAQCRTEAAKEVNEARQARDAMLRESHILFARGWTKLADYYESHKHTAPSSYVVPLPVDTAQASMTVLRAVATR
jgi:hypothetical protein